MKLMLITFLAAVLAGTNAAEREDLMQRDLLIETSDTFSVSDALKANPRDDELGANDDFWTNWQDDFETPQSQGSNISSASSDDEHDRTVGDIPEAAKFLLQKAEFVATAALPLGVEKAKSLLLPAALVVAALFVVAIAAVLVGVRRQQLSEPMFGPIELASNLPDPMTTSALSEAGCGSASDDDVNEGEDTGVTIVVDSGEEEEEKDEEFIQDSCTRSSP